MNLLNAQLGDVFRVFLDGEGNITSSSGMKTMLATVISSWML
jgi:hypothetical protein